MATAAPRSIPSYVSRTSEPSRRRDRIARLAHLMDSAFVVPGTRIRIGLDPIIGLIPGAGDLVSNGLAAYVVYEAYRAGLPRHALLRMVGNIFIDLIMGSVPVLGDFADMFWRANARNLAIFDSHIGRQRPAF